MEKNPIVIEDVSDSHEGKLEHNDTLSRELKVLQVISKDCLCSLIIFILKSIVFPSCRLVKNSAINPQIRSF